MKLSIIVPVYNEEKTVQLVMDKLSALSLPCDVEVLIIDDGSTDRTYQKIQTKVKGKQKTFRVLQHEKNKGKGQAIQTGIQATKGDYILIQDADLEYNPDEIIKLIEPILRKQKKKVAVYGSRFMDKKAVIPSLYLLGNKFLTGVTNILYSANLTDMETGYKLVPDAFLKEVKLYSKRFDIEPEITAKLIKGEYTIVEVPISYKGRSHLAGKKITFMDAFDAIKTLVYYRFFND